MAQEISRSPDSIYADLDGQTVMMSLSEGKYFGLNPVASRVWDLLETPQSVDTLCEQLLSEYAVDAAQCRRDVEAFIAEMLRLGIVRG